MNFFITWPLVACICYLFIFGMGEGVKSRKPGQLKMEARKGKWDL